MGIVLFLQNIYGAIDRFFVMLTIRFIWKSRRQPLQDSVRRFADIEQDTVWQLLHCFPHLPSDKIRAEVFVQIMEENFHVDLFQRLYKGLSKFPISPTNLEKQALYEKPEEMWRLLVYCFLGEDEATHRFRSIRAQLKDESVIAVLTKIIQDEAGHVVKAQALLREAGISAIQVRNEFLKIFFRRRYEGSVRKSKIAVEAFSNCVLSLAYYFLGCFAVRAARRKISSSSDSIQVDGLQSLGKLEETHA